MLLYSKFTEFYNQFKGFKDSIQMFFEYGTTGIAEAAAFIPVYVQALLGCFFVAGIVVAVYHVMKKLLGLVAEVILFFL